MKDEIECTFCGEPGGVVWRIFGLNGTQGEGANHACPGLSRGPQVTPAVTAAIWPTSGGGQIDLDALQKALAGEESLAVPTEQEVVEACVETWRGGDWQGWLKRMERRGLVVRKIKEAP